MTIDVDWDVKYQTKQKFLDYHLSVNQSGSGSKLFAKIVSIISPLAGKDLG